MFLEKRKTYRDKKYMQFIRENPCIICGVPDCDPHHLNPSGTMSGGKAIKCSDYRCIPLCRIHHQEFHSKGRLFFEKKYHIDLKEINIQFLEKFISATFNKDDKGSI